ncbi:MAG TPA: NTP transferase domain-containing protein, partial [Geopsychrobacteraceae bacterium]|nr:NTP transferase domain-containing protein [Geopsychrobacteraceae bacterium]
MKTQNLAAIVLAAGKGTRMKSSRAKVLHEIAGKPMLYYPLQAAQRAGFEQLQVVIGHQAEAVRTAVGQDGVGFVEQARQLGTGHALLCAADVMSDFSGTLLLLCGDVPLLRAETLQKMLEIHRNEQAAVTVLTAELENPVGYGRIIRDGETVLRIVEEKDAMADEALVCEINT